MGMDLDDDDDDDDDDVRFYFIDLKEYVLYLKVWVQVMLDQLKQFQSTRKINLNEWNVFQSELGSGDSDIDLDGHDLDDSDDDIEHGDITMGNTRARRKKQELEDSDNDF